MDKKRAIILYRMSTNRQDIETQKRMNRRFCKEKGYDIIAEYFEDGVSGYKNPLSRRPDLLNILDKAEKREFDVFVVYIFDRIVRREEEYPLILNQLTKNNIEIWSSSTGEKIKNEHTDKLTNYITGWQNEYESIKTSHRIKDTKRNKNEMGKFMGGAAPLGYELYMTGEINSKGKVMYDMRINENEADIIKLIFDMYVNQNYGVHLIAKRLNEMGYRSRTGTPMRQSTVHRVLRNTVYIGRRMFNKSTTTRDDVIYIDREEWKTQPYKEELRIIDDETFLKTQHLIDNKKKNHIPHNSKQLFSGMVYCGYCGSKLNTDYNRKKQYRKDGSYSISDSALFRCIEAKTFRSTTEHKQTNFGANKYQNTILSIITDFMSSIDKNQFFEEISKHRDGNIVNIQKQINNMDKIITDTSRLIQKMEKQIDEAVLNDDIVKMDLIIKRIKENEELVINTNNEKFKLQQQLKNSMTDNMKLMDVYQEIDDWTNKFNEVEDGRKKSMLLKVIDKIYLSKEDVKVVFKFELEQSVNISMFQTDENHHGVSDSIPSTKESITPYHDETDKYVYITMSQQVKA